MSSGCYLKCDGCGTTIGGEQVTKNPEPPLRQSWIEGGELRRRARRDHGWTYKDVPAAHPAEHHGQDFCPACSEKNKGAAP